MKTAMENLTKHLDLALGQVKLMLATDKRPTEEGCQELYKKMWELNKNNINLE